MLLVSDAFGLALFAVLGTEKALALGTAIPVAVLMGMMTGVVGGMLRDVLCNVIPMVLRQEIYATAAILGGALFTFFLYLELPQPVAIIGAILGALALRLAAIYWRVTLPAFQILEPEESPEDSK